MLQKLNERIQGVVAWVVIVLIALTFTLFGVDYYMQSHQSSDAEVTVNGQAISKQQFEISYRRNRQQRDPSQLTAASEIALKKQVLDDMVSNLISVQGARAGGFEVNAEQANAAILAIPQFQQDGRFSTERYQQALNGAMFTPETFQNEVRQGMLLNQQRFAFIGSSFALPAEIRRFVKLYMQTRDYDYMQIPTSLFLNKNDVTMAQVEEYYKTHRQEFLSPEKVSVDYIRLSMQHIRDGLKIKDEDIQRYYDDNQTSFRTPAQWKVAHILLAMPKDADEDTRNQLKQNADEAYQALQNNPAQFSELVKNMSSDKLSIDNEGTLPWIAAGQTEFDKALSTLTLPGQISEPLLTSNGYEIFKLIAYKPAKLKPLADVKTQISDQLAGEMAQAEYARILEQLTDLTYQTPDTLQPAADELKLPIEQSEPFSRAGGNTEITKNKQIINTAFSHDVMELSNNSEPVQLDNDSVIVLRVNKHIPASNKPLSEVKDLITDKLALQQAEMKAQALGKTLLGDSNTEKAMATAGVDEKELVWKKVDDATRDSDKTDAMINDLAFSIARPESKDGRGLVNGDYVIVRLKKINNGRYKSLDNEQRASIAQQIEASYGLMDYDLYINNLVKTAKIVKN
ncbi:SurA N-terminal domain-containing protein [Legionella sp. CNM-4043-24]|uniref:SurA N-terminal domain-containing protein n=1 Tax=Legionella sp. CNM-4043-24 TaxID=3421646 RepID=UPI00403B091E